MRRHVSKLIFIVVLAAAGLFVFITSDTLPERVASHFGSSGAADSYMSRSGYVTSMLIFVLGLPLVTTGCMTLVFRSATTSLNIPNRDYWLAPERRADAVAFLNRHSMRFGAFLAVFLSYMHWLVVRANFLQPPQLSNGAIYVGLALFCFDVHGVDGVALDRVSKASIAHMDVFARCHGSHRT